MSSLSTCIWRKYRWFGLAWIVLTGLVLFIYNNSLDRERVCAYQYCPSSLVIAAAVGCIVLSITWIEFFFSFLRPLLKRYIAIWIGTEIVHEHIDYSHLQIMIFNRTIDRGNEFWSAAPEATLGQHLLVVFFDFLCFILLLVLPTSLFIAGASLVAYLEQNNFFQ